MGQSIRPMDEGEEWGHDDPWGGSLRSRGHLTSRLTYTFNPLPTRHARAPFFSDKRKRPSSTCYDPTTPRTAASAPATSTTRDRLRHFALLHPELTSRSGGPQPASVLLLLPWAPFSIFYIISLPTCLSRYTYIYLSRYIYMKQKVAMETTTAIDHSCH